MPSVDVTSASHSSIALARLETVAEDRAIRILFRLTTPVVCGAHL